MTVTSYFDHSVRRFSNSVPRRDGTRSQLLTVVPDNLMACDVPSFGSFRTPFGTPPFSQRKGRASETEQRRPALFLEGSSSFRGPLAGWAVIAHLARAEIRSTAASIAAAGHIVQGSCVSIGERSVHSRVRIAVLIRGHMGMTTRIALRRWSGAHWLRTRERDDRPQESSCNQAAQHNSSNFRWEPETGRRIGLFKNEVNGSVVHHCQDSTL